MNKPKAIGTAAETAVVRWLKTSGFPGADRRTLQGSNDRGDILVCPGFIIEVKVRGRASSAALGQPGPAQLEGWMAELETEMSNAQAKHGFLIVKRKGTTDPGQWWAYARYGYLIPRSHKNLRKAIVNMSAHDMLAHINQFLQGV